MITVYNYKGKEIGLIMNRITAEHDKQYRHLFIDTDVHESFRTIANNFAIENNYTMVDQICTNEECINVTVQNFAITSNLCNSLKKHVILDDRMCLFQGERITTSNFDQTLRSLYKQSIEHVYLQNDNTLYNANELAVTILKDLGYIHELCKYPAIGRCTNNLFNNNNAAGVY